MPTVKLSPIWVGTQFFTSAGVVLSGGKIYQYQAGTTTPQSTYTDSTGTITNANPIILDSAGRYSAQIWFISGDTYKLVLTDSVGTILLTEDNLSAVNDPTIPAASEWIASGFTPTYVSTTTFTTPGNTTSTFQIGRRIQATITAGTVYGTITNSVFTSLTTVTVALDSGNLDSGLSVVNIGLLNGTNPSVPAVLDYAFATGPLTVTGNFSASGTSSVTGNASVGGNETVTGNLTVNGSGVQKLGSNWNIDANGQLTNNGDTIYIGSFYASAQTVSGSNVPVDTQISQQGSNFSLSTGAVVTAAAGLYKLFVTFAVADPGVSNVNTSVWFNASAGTVYGPSSSATAYRFSTPGASGGVDSTATIECYWQATAGANIIVTTNQTFGSGTFFVAIGTQYTIMRVG